MDSPSVIISRLCEASRVPGHKFINETLLLIVRDVVIDSRLMLDPYCHARVQFCAQCISEDFPVENIVRALARLPFDTLVRPHVGEIPRLIAALPPKKMLAVLLAGFWLEDTAEVVNIAVNMSNYRCARAVPQTIEWFKSDSPRKYLAAMGVSVM
jgi:hypothetical protein